MSNVCACETLDAMCAVCGAHCTTWIGGDEHGDREYAIIRYAYAREEPVAIVWLDG